jgi:hypothetical protein
MQSIRKVRFRGSCLQRNVVVQAELPAVFAGVGL